MLKVTIRSLRAHLARFVLTATVVMMAVAFVAGGEVMTDTIRDSLSSMLADRYAYTDAVVRSTDTVGTFYGVQHRPVTEDVRQLLLGVPGVAAAEGEIQQPIRPIGKDGQPIGSPHDINPTFGVNWVGNPLLSQWKLSSGSAPQAGEVAITKRLADAHGFDTGDSITIPLAPGTKTFRVSGIATLQGAPAMGASDVILFATPDAQALLVEPGGFDWIEVRAADGVTQEQLKAAIASRLPVRGRLQVLTGEAFVKQTSSPFEQAFSAFNDILLVLGIVALFVAGFVIYNTFSLVITQRAREMALLRAVGAGRLQLSAAVIGEALVIGSVASVAGVGVGIVLGGLITTLLTSVGFVPPDSPLVVLPGKFVPGFGLGVLFTVLAALFPAYRASRIRPVAALRELAVEPRHFSWLRVAAGGLLGTAGAASLLYGLFGSGSHGLTFVGIGMAAIFLGAAALAPAFIPPVALLLGLPVRRLRGIAGSLAVENAARNPKRSGATASAVMVGVALVGLVAILGESVRVATSDAVDRALAGDFVIDSLNTALTGVSPDLAAEVSRLPTVQAAAGIRIGAASVQGAPDLLLGSDPVSLQQVVNIEVIEGRLDALGDDGLAVKREEAKLRGWGIGTPVTAHFLYSGDKTLKVRAIFDSDLFAGGRGLLVSRSLFERNFAPNQQTDLQVYLKLRPGVTSAQARPAIDAVVARFPPAQLEDLTEFKKKQTEPIDRAIFFIWALLLLSVVISFIGILNTLLLSVFERTREIGLLRAAGMSRPQVRSAVRWEAAIITIIGTLLGIGIGVFFARALIQAMADEGLKTFAIPYLEFAFIVGVAFVASILAAWYPASRASRLDILDAIAEE